MIIDIGIGIGLCTGRDIGIGIGNRHKVLHDHLAAEIDNKPKLDSQEGLIGPKALPWLDFQVPV